MVIITIKVIITEKVHVASLAPEAFLVNEHEKNWDQYKERRYEIAFMRYLAESTSYRVIHKLGYGSYGITYLLEYKDCKKKAVLKRMRARGRKNKKIRNHFFFEIATLQHLKDQHIPKVLGGGQIEDIPFYIMEYIDAKTFEQLIFQDRKKFTLDESLEIVAELFKIVFTIHEAGYVHRDLRIPNILIVNGSLRIIDFGLAVPLQSEDLQHFRNPKKLKTPESDLYAIGHFLLFLLYSNYDITDRKERPWQEELQLPHEIEYLIERLLGIQKVFPNVTEASEELDRIRNYLSKQQRII